MLTNDFDIVVPTESWSGITINTTFTGEAVIAGYVMKRIPRRHRKGAGVAQICYTTLTRHF